jgi:hypothetical protein
MYFNYPYANGRFLFLAIALSLSTALAAKPERSLASELLTRAELKSAVEKGETIVGREINGEDIVAVLTPWITPDSRCAPKVGLHVEKGVIRGDVKFEFKTPVAKPTSQS